MKQVGEGSILIIDDLPENLTVLREMLSDQGYKIRPALSGEIALNALKADIPDLILLDIMMPGMDGFEVCVKLKSEVNTQDIPVIFMTALNDAKDKIRAFEVGGIDYITKPFHSGEVLARVATHIANRRLQQKLYEQNEHLLKEIEAHQQSKDTVGYLLDEIKQGHNFGEIIGESKILEQLLEKTSVVANTDATVLIYGETGTGKELIARAIHNNSQRYERPLLKVNCAALPKDLIESEIFGHEKGAFTGAIKQRKGKFELADKGTIFLDEIGELSLEAQAKLLRILQEQEFERIGSEKSIKVDVRVIAATNRFLKSEVEAGNFRADLFYRLNVIPLSVPSLRERKADIPLLADFFVNKAARKLGRTITGISKNSMDQLIEYSWPGNIRELENVIERSTILSSGSVIEIGEHLEKSTDTEKQTGSLNTLEEVERLHITYILTHTGGVIEGLKGAANILGLNPSTLRGRMRKLEIDTNAWR